MSEINFKFTVDTCFEDGEVKRFRACENDDERFQVLNEIFGEDPNVWDSYYEAAFKALVASVGPVDEGYRANRTDLCEECKWEDHQTCSLSDMSCPCCLDTANQMKEME